MFLNTKPFIPKILDKKFRLNTGVEVPKNAVNLAHYYTPSLDSQENIIIGDNSSFILENIHQPQESMMYVDTDNKLKSLDSSDPNVPSELIMLTNEFKDNIPLYYRYKLKKFHYDKDRNLDGEYFGDSIQLTDIHNNKLPSSYKYKIVLKPCRWPDDKFKNLYYVYIYTNFQIENNFQIKCTYNAVEIGPFGGICSSPSVEENINPQMFFSKADSILEAMSKDNKYYIQKSSQKIKSSFVYTKGIIDDPRTPEKIRLQLTVICEDGSEEVLHIPKQSDEPILLYNRKSALSSELDNYIDTKQKITDKPVKDIIGYTDEHSPIVSIKTNISYAERDKRTISIYVKPDGTSPITAETTLDTGYIVNTPNNLFKKKNNKILTCFSIKYLDRNPIKLEKPRERNVYDNWHIRVQNGRFVTKKDGKTLHYFIPEYYAQQYSESLGYPYKTITREEPIKLSSRTIKTRNAPLFITKDSDGNPNNIKIYRVDKYNHKLFINIENWNDKDGIINLTEMISENDNIFIDYVYEEQFYVYRGYEYTSEKNIKSHIILDCNPNKHHFITSTANNDILDVPSFSLIDRIVYMYIKPAIIESDVDGKVYHDKVLFHTLEELSDDEVADNNYILIGTIYVRPNSSFYSLELIDTRTRGGGILDEINDNIRKEIEPESDYYWDIGQWDGEGYPENSVIVVRLDKRILVQFGGRFTEEQVEKAVNKHLAVGTLALIEYVSTYQDDSFMINNLEITKTPVNKLDYKPKGFARTVNVNFEIGAKIIGLSVENSVQKPSILKIKSEDKIPNIVDIKSHMFEPSIVHIDSKSFEASIVNIKQETIKVKMPILESISFKPIIIDIEKHDSQPNILDTELLSYVPKQLELNVFSEEQLEIMGLKLVDDTLKAIETPEIIKIQENVFIPSTLGLSSSPVEIFNILKLKAVEDKPLNIIGIDVEKYSPSIVTLNTEGIETTAIINSKILEEKPYILSITPTEEVNKLLGMSSIEEDNKIIGLETSDNKTEILHVDIISENSELFSLNTVSEDSNIFKLKTIFENPNVMRLNLETNELEILEINNIENQQNEVLSLTSVNDDIKLLNTKVLDTEKPLLDNLITVEDNNKILDLGATQEVPTILNLESQE